jgi:hypothetical protein
VVRPQSRARGQGDELACRNGGQQGLSRYSPHADHGGRLLGVKDGIPGAGYIKDVWNAVMAAGKIGSYTPDGFWKERFVFASNPQNDAPYIKNYLGNLLPNYWQKNNIPTPPVMFTELGSSIEQTGSEEKQAEWLYAQIEASLPGIAFPTREGISSPAPVLKR